MIFWGIISAGMAFIQGVNSFYMMRFLLGIAEAGFFPGVMLYLTYWTTNKQRALIIGLFFTGGHLGALIGSPISGYLLGLNFLGFQGWQILFLVEAMPAILMD